MMISCIRSYMACATVVAMLLSTDVAAAAATVPRGWLVTKGDAQAVLVGESHFGTPVENDFYFDTVVKPSHAAADMAVMETYFGPEQTRNEGWERLAPCENDPMGLRTERVRLAFDALISATRANHLEVPNWLEGWEVVPQFPLASFYFISFTIESLGKEYDTAIDAQGGPGISFRLRGKGTPAKKTIGLDTFKDRRSQFCSASAAYRADFVADQALKLAHLLLLKQSDPSYASLGKLAGVAGQSLAEVIGCVDRSVPCAFDQLSPSDRLILDKGWMSPFSQATFEISLKKRTRAWLPLIATTISGHRRTFIIVGARHLPDLRVGDSIEPGLISLLRQQGFSVTRIAAASDISATFLAPSWYDRVRSALGSL